MKRGSWNRTAQKYGNNSFGHLRRSGRFAWFALLKVAVRAGAQRPLPSAALVGMYAVLASFLRPCVLTRVF